jgi:proteasome lid subunit RPN8/RPN11
MTLKVDPTLLKAIQENGENAYPEEGAGLLLGRADGDQREVLSLLHLPNLREDGSRHNRFLIDPKALLQGELEAMRLGMDVIGIFHSHPDSPNQPSEYDREWALPWYSYIITTVQNGHATSSRSWRLDEDRSRYTEEQIIQNEEK